MFDRPRNWKWMVPAGAVAPLLWWWHDWDSSGGIWHDAAVVPLLLTIICGLAALMNLVLYVYHYFTEMYSEIRETQNRTPEVRMFEAAKSIHPDAIKALLVHRRTIWRIKYVPLKDLVDWILDDAEIVHAGFVDFVLEHSSEKAIMPKRMLSEGSRAFDPEQIVSDYEQYDALILLLQNKLMITTAYGNQAPQWLPPWTPTTVRHRFGLDETVGAEPEEMSEALKTVVRAQAAVSSGNGNGGLKQLDGEGQTRVQSPVKQEPKRQVAEITDEEWEASQREMADYAKKFVDGRVPS